eukprot:s2850_g2.t1
MFYVYTMPPDSDATTVAASEGEVQKKLAASKKPQEPETNTSTEADSHRPKLSQRTQSKEFLKEKEEPERSPDHVGGAPGVKTTAVKARAQPTPARVPPKTEEQATAEAVAQCLQRKSTAELNKTHGFDPSGSPQESKDQAQEGSDSEDVNSDMESEDYQKKELLAKAKRAAHARYMRFSRSLVSKRTPVEDTRQYLVWDKEGSEETVDHVCSELFKAAEGGEDPLATQASRGRSKKRKDKRKDKKDKKKRKTSSSSPSSSKKDKKDKKSRKEVISSDSSVEEETEEQKQKRLQKEAEAERKKEEKDAEAAKKKLEREKNQELKKEQKKGTQAGSASALNKLGTNILKAAGLDEKLTNMSLGPDCGWQCAVGNLGAMPELISKADEIEIEHVRIPVYNPKAPGEASVELYPMVYPHRVLAYLFDEVKLEMPTAEVQQYWRHARTMQEPWACAHPATEWHVPVGLHGDGAKLWTQYRVEKYVAVWMNLPLFRPRSIRHSRFLLFSIEKWKMIKNRSLNVFWRKVVWSLNAVAGIPVWGQVASH